MSNYQFLPGPPRLDQEHTYVHWNDGFTDDEITHIIDIGERLRPAPASVGGNFEDLSKVRKSNVSWISCDDDTQWLYERLAFIARQLNSQFYQFDLHGFHEDFQYTVYEGQGKKKGHYGWHIDKGNTKTAIPRKLSMVLQLSDPSEYEGGVLELQAGHEAEQVEKKKGYLVAFPSYVLHRVTPVTKGLRRSLVVWTAGPAFK